MAKEKIFLTGMPGGNNGKRDFLANFSAALFSMASSIAEVSSREWVFSMLFFGACVCCAEFRDHLKQH